MQNTQSASWTPAQNDLWARITRHDLELGQPLGFSRRIARDKGWSHGFTLAVIGEYRRFCFLAVASERQITPSEEVDEVWHMHLTYSRDYWDIWCREVLRAPLHHDPTQGSRADQARFRNQYAATLAFYETFFGPPDAKYWPATHDRFRDKARFRTIDTDRWLLLPRPSRFFQWLQGGTKL